MRRINRFLIMSFVSGLITVFLAIILWKIFWAFLRIVRSSLEPFATALHEYIGVGTSTAWILATCIGLGICFAIGIVVKTRFWPLGKRKFIIRSAAIFYPNGWEGSEKIGFITSYPREGYCVCLELMPPTSFMKHTMRNERVFPLPNFSMQDVIRDVFSGGTTGSVPSLGDLDSLATLIAEGKRP